MQKNIFLVSFKFKFVLLLLGIICYILLWIPQAAFETDKLPVVTESSVVMITGPYDRRLLAKEILEFCGALPIYNTEHIKYDASKTNETTSKQEKF